MGYFTPLDLPSDGIADSRDSVSRGRVHCLVPVQVSDSVLVVLLREDRYYRYNRCYRYYRLLWMPPMPLRPLNPLIVATLPCFCSLSTPTMPFKPFPPDGLLSLLGLLALLGLCPTLPIFLKLPKLSPSRWDTTDNHGHPRQGQYIGQHSPNIFYKIFCPKVWWSQNIVVTLQSNLESDLICR